MKKSKIIAFERGAEFYFDLGFRKIQKGNLKSALRYIEKAVRLKPMIVLFNSIMPAFWRS